MASQPDVPARVARLRALDEFRCIGAECPDDCCHGWRVEVDGPTLRAWRGHPSPDVRSRLVSSLEPDEPPGTTARLLQTADRRCIHLNDRGLCSVHAQLGHGWLPELCRTYPRERVASGWLTVDTAHLSCPEIARILVKNAKKGADPVEAAPLSPDLETGSLLGDLAATLAWYVQVAMESRACSPGVRLYDIAGVLTYIVERAAAGSFTRNQLQDKTGRTAPAIDRRLATHGRKLNKRPNLADLATFWGYVRESFDALTLPRFPAIAQRAFYAATSAPELSGNAAAFLARMRRAQRMIESDFPWVSAAMDAYLRVKFYNHGFPWRPFAGNFSVSFLDAVLGYYQCWLAIYSHLLDENAIDERSLVRIIYSVEKALSHNTRIFDFLKSNAPLLSLSYRSAFLISTPGTGELRGA